MDPWLWCILLLLLGIGLACLEPFIPSFGILSVMAVSSMVTATVFAFLHGPWFGLAVLVFVVVGLPTGFFVVVQWWPHTPLGRRVVLSSDPEADERPGGGRRQWLKSLIGRRAKAKSRMLPSGAIEIDGRTIDAFTQGQPVEANETVEIVDVHGMQVMVRPVEESSRPSSPEAEGDAPPQKQAPARDADADRSTDPLDKPIDTVLPRDFDSDLFQ